MSDKKLSDPIQLLKEVDNFSQQKLKNRDALHILFEICLSENNRSLLDELTFTSKYINGLARVLTNAASNSEFSNIESIKKDYSENILKATEHLKKIISKTDEQTQRRFNIEFLDLTPEAFQRLKYLFDDLEWTKKYLNAHKRDEVQ